MQIAFFHHVVDQRIGFFEGAHSNVERILQQGIKTKNVLSQT